MITYTKKDIEIEPYLTSPPKYIHFYWHGYLRREICSCRVYFNNFRIRFYRNCKVCSGYGVMPIPLEDLR